MKTSEDDTSSVVNGRPETKRSVLSIAFSLLATGAAMASPSSMIPGDALLAFHVK
jgi:hypothetical protein